ncbi:prolyl oligopeptidase family serine peptidase [bacterium]|nr:prolyl oligopeptidase family serine peptidase [bacterium]
MTSPALESIITGELLTKKAVKFSEVCVMDGKVYNVESRPEEKGRGAIYNLTDKKDLLPAPFSAKNGVHEYGGDALCGDKDGIYFTNKKDHQIYSLSKGQPKKLTNLENVRFAEPLVCGKFLFAIFEDHRKEEVQNGIIKIDRESGACTISESEHDFYSGLTLSPDEKHLAFFTWDFPYMSWDRSDVWKVRLNEEGDFVERAQISPKGDISSCDPRFSPSGKLFYVCDKTGFWNLYEEDGSVVCEMEADFSKPHWHMGHKRYTFATEEILAAVYTKNATDYLCLIIDENEKTLDLPFTSIPHLVSHGGKLYFIAASKETMSSIYSYDLKTSTLSLEKTCQELELDPSWISIPKEISFTTRHNEKAYAFYYPPTNPHYTPKKSEKPPLLLISHGGPTGHNPPIFNLAIQYWTSRGFAVCDVNYSGSSGFGRAYRKRLYGTWGVKDVDDCEDCALYLVEKGLVDKDRLTVRGGSAGGYTTLALLTFRDTFCAGASYFGVSDIGLLALHTHKFEAKYMDLLVGEYPKEKALFEERSPLFHTDKMKKPILILQGDEDKVVPVEQAEKMYHALLEKKIPTAYLLFKGEGHGFTKKENIIKAIESELYFYQKIFGGECSFEAPPITIENL